MVTATPSRKRPLEKTAFRILLKEGRGGGGGGGGQKIAVSAYQGGQALHAVHYPQGGPMLKLKVTSIYANTYV